MRTLLASSASLAMLFWAATAGGQEIEASISKIDRQSDRIILNDGRSYRVSDDIALESLSEGVEVRITFRTMRGERVATDVVALFDDRRYPILACRRHAPRPDS